MGVKIRSTTNHLYIGCFVVSIFSVMHMHGSLVRDDFITVVKFAFSFVLNAKHSTYVLGYPNNVT
jgi:hypothetical protein